MNANAHVYEHVRKPRVQQSVITRGGEGGEGVKINDPRTGVHPQSVIWAYDGPNSIRFGRYFVRVDPGIIF